MIPSETPEKGLLGILCLCAPLPYPEYPGELRMVTTTVGERIRAVRLERGLTGDHMAEHLGISRPYYTQLEGGKRRLTVHHLQQIARILEVPIGSLCGEPIPYEARVPWRGRRRHLRPMDGPDLVEVLRPVLKKDAEGGAAWVRACHLFIQRSRGIHAHFCCVLLPYHNWSHRNKTAEAVVSVSQILTEPVSAN